MNSDKLKRKLFCYLYLKLGNAAEAAVKAGFPKESALYEAVKTLSALSYKRLLRDLAESVSPIRSTLVNAGLERLAFGSANDAAYLVFSDEIPSPDALAKLDLFNVSEIKRVKGGGVEVKIFDRQKALEKIFDFANSMDSQGSAVSFINAITSQDEPQKDADIYDL